MSGAGRIRIPDGSPEKIYITQITPSLCTFYIAPDKICAIVKYIFSVCGMGSIVLEREKGSIVLEISKTYGLKDMS